MVNFLVLSPEVENDENLDKTYYVYLPPELCLIHPLPGALVRGAQRLPSIMRRVESMLLAVQLKDMIRYPVPATKILEALTAASCQETFCYERAELLGDAYLKWAAPGVLPVFDEDSKEAEHSIFDEECPADETEPLKDFYADDCIDNMREDGEVESDSSCYRVLSSKTLADVVEALIGVYYVEAGEDAANHLMKWIGIQVDIDPHDIPCPKPYNIPESIMRSVDFDALEGALNVKFRDRGLLVEAITHASRPSSGVSCYQRLEFVGDAVLDHLITKHLFFTYTDLPPGRLTDLRAAAVNNENFARVSVKHKLHVHLRHGSSALEAQIGIAQNPQKKMAQKLAARNALVVLKEKEKESAIAKDVDKNGERKNGIQIFTRQTLNDICLRRQWPMPQYRCVNEGGPAHAKRFVYAVRVNTSDRGWTDECIGEPMPSVKKAKDSAATLLLELLSRCYPDNK
ncbi:hypothetical protein BHE74_00037725 [Ensete ventricosum]|nr:hypothetical protein GW17_00022699 [Ensete ventricosum]RWW55629.1 hypothetical protein BHE74_00037725 [Ensete ventricosum]RZS19531.1 hypothetical protein BHM03_00051935 [Ensete ventricosum]